jgi:hypothetical protein
MEPQDMRQARHLQQALQGRGLRQRLVLLLESVHLREELRSWTGYTIGAGDEDPGGTSSRDVL